MWNNPLLLVPFVTQNIVRATGGSNSKGYLSSGTDIGLGEDFLYYDGSTSRRGYMPRGNDPDRSRRLSKRAILLHGSLVEGADLLYGIKPMNSRVSRLF